MLLEYVLITPARNEEEFIDKTIQSVLSQTVLPKKWIIVSDGSTDRTNEIVLNYATDRNWIEFIRIPDRNERHFAGKANAFNIGYERIRDIQYNVIGNLDADVSFEKDYLEFLLRKFLEISDLGVGGTRYIESGYMPVYSYKDVSGQCQLFRRECFDEIGGYVPCEWGGIDNIAVLTARMKGWQTRTFDEKLFYHHRPMSTAGRNKWTAKIKHGVEDYLLGNHPLWEIFRIGYQVTKKPYIIGGTLLMYGYVKGLFGRLERPVSEDFINFYRKEQIKRLKAIFRKLMRFKVKLEET